MTSRLYYYDTNFKQLEMNNKHGIRFMYANDRSSEGIFHYTYFNRKPTLHTRIHNFTLTKYSKKHGAAFVQPQRI